LISQLPRSGGSLFSQLCDHHPQLLTFPFELRISAQKTVWPELDPTENPARLFARLFQGELCRLAVEGYRKRAKARQYQRLKFNYSPRRHYLSFIDLLNAPRNARDVLDAFFSAFFQAWPDGRCADPRFIVAFAPKVAIRPKSVAAFFTDYPDGGLVTIIRNPADWFVSRRAHTANGVAPHADLDIEMTHWNRLARAALKYHRKYAERFLLLSFRELVRSRESTMRRFSEWCGIDFDPALTRQTFANKPIAPNTNFLDPPEGLSEAVLHRASVLEDDQRSRALELTSSMRELLEDAGCRC
jgi:hypothetical protein